MPGRAARNLCRREGQEHYWLQSMLTRFAWCERRMPLGNVNLVGCNSAVSTESTLLLKFPRVVNPVIGLSCVIKVNGIHLGRNIFWLSASSCFVIVSDQSAELSLFKAYLVVAGTMRS